MLGSVEKTLRRLVRTQFEHRFGSNADARIEANLGNEALQQIERARSKSRSLLPDTQSIDLLDYTYIGQLVQLMVSRDGWEMFKPGFRDKRELEDFARAITKVRNEAAHFRHVPESDLVRCRSAAEDLLRRVAKLDEATR